MVYLYASSRLSCYRSWHSPLLLHRARVSQYFANIDAFLLSQMQTNRIPGLAVGLVHGDQIVHLRGFGIADASGNETITPQTPFIIGSDSKSITALAILQLMEAGKIGLDNPAHQYLPWFQVANTTAYWPNYRP